MTPDVVKCQHSTCQMSTYDMSNPDKNMGEPGLKPVENRIVLPNAGGEKRRNRFKTGGFPGGLARVTFRHWHLETGGIPDIPQVSTLIFHRWNVRKWQCHILTFHRLQTWGIPGIPPGGNDIPTPHRKTVFQPLGFLGDRARK